MVLLPSQQGVQLPLQAGPPRVPMTLLYVAGLPSAVQEKVGG